MCSAQGILHAHACDQVGFAVPLNNFGTIEAWWRGILLGLGPCIGTKLVSGLFAYQRYKSEDAKLLAQKASWATKVFQPTQLLVGIAMVARGEFAYLVAQDANAELQMISGDVYAAVVVALVMATVFSPFTFRWALGVFDRATPVHRSLYIGGDRKEFAKRAFVIRLAGAHTPGVQREIFDALHSAGVDILEARLATVRADDSAEAEITNFVNNFTVRSLYRPRLEPTQLASPMDPPRPHPPP